MSKWQARMQVFSGLSQARIFLKKNKKYVHLNKLF